MSRLALHFRVTRQPDDETCGPSCLYSIYRHFGERVPFRDVLAEVPRLKDGGTLGVHLARHALDRGFKPTIYTYNLRVFDPTWFGRGRDVLRRKLEAQAKGSKARKVREASRAYAAFLRDGGEVVSADLRGQLLRGFLEKGWPVLTGLSATYLYRSPREGRNGWPDNVTGEPTGHFVVLYGYDRGRRAVRVGDPWGERSGMKKLAYWAPMDRVINAILLGIVTFDANLVVFGPKE